MKKKSTIKRWIARMATIVFGLLLGWLAIELLARLAFPLLPYPIQVTTRHVYRNPFTQETILPEQIWQDDDHFQFISRANVDNELQYPDPRIGFFVTTKNWLDAHSHVGFRVPDLSWEPRWPVDTLFVGDSFTFCYTDYVHCWTQQLATQHDLSVVNMGQVATGSQSHLNILQTFGLPYEPQLVVWQWYGNDFNDDYGFAVDTGKIEPFTEPNASFVSEPRSRLSRWFYEHAVVYRLAYIMRMRWGQPTLNHYLADPYWFDGDDFSFAYGRSYTYDSTDMANPKNVYGRDQTFTALQQARTILGDTPLVIILIPSKEEVYGRWLEPTLGPEYLQTLAQGRQQMLHFCQVEKFLCFDALPSLQVYAENGELLYWTHDSHLNDLGNQYLAAIVWEFLINEGLMKEK